VRRRRRRTPDTSASSWDASVSVRTAETAEMDEHQASRGQLG